MIFQSHVNIILYLTLVHITSPYHNDLFLILQLIDSLFSTEWVGREVENIFPSLYRRPDEIYGSVGWENICSQSPSGLPIILLFSSLCYIVVNPGFVGNNMLHNQSSMHTRPCDFQLLIFLYLFCVFLDPSWFSLVPRNLPTVGVTYRHMIIQTPM